MFDRILIAVDGSECARRAARVGFDVASTVGAAVDVLLAVEPGSPATEAESAAREEATKVLDETARLAEGIDAGVTTQLVEGHPAGAILDHANEARADLIVMGRQGRAGLVETFLGSTTERVLRRAAVPALVVPDGDEGSVEPFADVLVTTDGSDVADVAGPLAGDVAAAYGAVLHLLTVVDVQASAGLFDAGGVSREYVERLEAQGETALDRLADRIGDLDVERRSELRRGIAHEAIAAYVDEAGVDLVVMSSAGQASLGGQHLGSTTGRILRTVEVPVLVATPTDDPDRT